MEYYSSDTNSPSQGKDGTRIIMGHNSYDDPDSSNSRSSTDSKKNISTEKHVIDLEEKFQGDTIYQLSSRNSFHDESSYSPKPGKIERFFKSLNAETNGIEPIPDEQKTDNSLLNAASMWFSANLVLASYSLGVLGTAVYGLNFGQSAMVIIFFNIIGLLPVAFFSVFGAQLSMRQMILSRFLIGNVTARIFSIFNTIACGGWVVVNTIAAAQLLNMVNIGSGHNAPLWAGCLIVIGGTLLVSFFGYGFIHTYEKYSWIPNFAIFLVIIARLKMSGQYEEGPWTGGRTTAGNVLSFGSTVFGFAAGWTTYAADYTVYMPKSTNKCKIFFALVAGLSFPLFFTQLIGAAAGTGVIKNAQWAKLYDKNGTGGLTYGIIVQDSLHGFGQFCCVLLAMSTVAINIPGIYTLSMSVPAIWSKLNKVPRIFWTFASNAVILGIAIPACYYFTSFMQNFMDSISYFLAIYIAMSLSEHFIYRKGKFENYNIEDWNNPKNLPIGYAGVSGLIVGAFGVAIGMVQTYWRGEIGRLIGKDGGDIGFELGLSWSFIAYNLIRPLELKYFGR
ncbi:hypothetical protein TBLA_0B04820 [Henningerozyma blattae CBS 6284]|uniref:Purine-cytosine permease n=1 Tax=Henningerozyma blattae (strain ATCC 34711 / CBS 6284 / DSM 70876 / NBRC 10599 / NRRL Y-10934 / UCD 77-7) TaxID=1071380 RepID=I2GYW4_HENB6|nr:hypothetical protein TBLA_0B04820 [Tetrapisispora blattae CBS 6284]CCH59316.1 hypothetical protein TBLA_0B04820 [Tetrapisispora blattae CBS 6284]